MRKVIFAVSLTFLAAIFFTGCKRNGQAVNSPGSAKSPGYFQTPFQDESTFLVDTIVSDVAEQIYYAKFHKLPPDDVFNVSAKETPDSPIDAPVYDLQIDLDPGHKDLKYRLNVNGPIWSPQVYNGVAAILAKAVGLASGANEESKDTALLAKLTDSLGTTIEKENENLSVQLDGDFTNPTLHEEAAVLLGAFTLREHAGYFCDIRTPMCRITAHLAMARYLGGPDSTGINGRVANAMLLTLMNNEADAVAALGGINTNSTVLNSWVRAINAWNTGDYRPLDNVNGLTQIECVGWFCALQCSENADTAWGRLSDVQKKTPDFIRLANSADPSVGTGHELLDVALPAEFSELGEVYHLSQQKQLTRENAVEALNRMPDRCFSIGPDGKQGVHIIGWGLWAGFFQRELCHAITQSFDMLQWKWGVPDDAKTFADKQNQMFGGLLLYPFVRRMDAVNVDEFHKSVDDGFKVTVATPQLVPTECWNYLCYNFQGQSYQPNPNPHVNEWYKHNPPPATAFDAYPRLDHPSLTDRPDAVAKLNQLHALAPYDWNYSDYIASHQYNKSPTYQQAQALYAAVSPFSSYAMSAIANSVKDDPQKYEYWMSRAAVLNPSQNFRLADYFEKLPDDDKAATYIEKGNTLDPDSVSASYYASWLIKYYLKKGRTEDARKEADFGADVYSSAGLEAKAEFLEATGDYNGAYEWYAKNDDRYDEPGPLVAFCQRYKNKTGDYRFDLQVQQRMGKIFPNGVERAALANFKGAPPDGVLVNEETDQTRKAGMKKGDVIVSIYGIRVHNFTQYEVERDMASNPELDLIVWNGSGYHEIKASPPQKLFGGDFEDYTSGN